jgi:alcohol dehydrogenase class IV
MELNKPYAAKKYAHIAQALGVYESSATDEENTKRAIDRIKSLQKEINAPYTLKPYINGAKIDMPQIIESIKKTTGHIKCNPRPLDENLMTEIFNMCQEA